MLAPSMETAEEWAAQRLRKKSSSIRKIAGPDVDLEAVFSKMSAIRISRGLQEHELDSLSDDAVANDLLPRYAHQLVAALNSPHRNEKLKAAVCLRKFVSVSNGDSVWDHVRCVVELDIINRLVDLLLEEDGILQYEIMWCLTNLAAGPHAYAQAVMDSRALPALLRALKHARGWKIRWQAVWALANLCGDSRGMRDAVLAGAPDLVPALLRAAGGLGDPDAPGATCSCGARGGARARNPWGNNGWPGAPPDLDETASCACCDDLGCPPEERPLARLTLSKFVSWALANLSRWPAEPRLGADIATVLLPSLPFLVAQVNRLARQPGGGDPAHLGDVLRCLRCVFQDPNKDKFAAALPDAGVTDALVECMSGAALSGETEVAVAALGVLVNISTSDDRRVSEALARNRILVERLTDFVSSDSPTTWNASIVQHSIMLFSNISASHPRSLRSLSHLWPEVLQLARHAQDGKTLRECAWCLATAVDSSPSGGTGRRGEPGWWPAMGRHGLLEALVHLLATTAPDGPGESGPAKNEDPQLFAKLASAAATVAARAGTELHNSASQDERTEAERSLALAWEGLWRLWWEVVGAAKQQGGAAAGAVERMHDGWRRGYATVAELLDGDVFRNRTKVQRQHLADMAMLTTGMDHLRMGMRAPPPVTDAVEVEILAMLKGCSIGD